MRRKANPLNETDDGRTCPLGYHIRGDDAGAFQTLIEHNLPPIPSPNTYGYRKLATSCFFGRKRIASTWN